jgi:hypothetical protein
VFQALHLGLYLYEIGAGGGEAILGVYKLGFDLLKLLLERGPPE